MKTTWKIITLLLLAAMLPVYSGCSRKKKTRYPIIPMPKAFEISVDSIRVEGSVTDQLSETVSLTLDSTAVSLSGNSFDETVDMRERKEFTLEAVDEAGNRETLTIEAVEQ
ncbi:MAG: hypothetical protein E3J72_12315 [Planctomycetota bacterium]|nr:MAG: hypothetical protein E3J72_12315 [Planctomycetota bacterium]